MATCGPSCVFHGTPCRCSTYEASASCCSSVPLQDSARSLAVCHSSRTLGTTERRREKLPKDARKSVAARRSELGTWAGRTTERRVGDPDGIAQPLPFPREAVAHPGERLLSRVLPPARHREAIDVAEAPVTQRRVDRAARLVEWDGRLAQAGAPIRPRDVHRGARARRAGA